MKRILAILLALLLGLGLFVHAAAAIIDYRPIITQQPSSYVVLFSGNRLNLEVKAKLPVSGGKLSYAWYDYSWQPGDTKAPVGTKAKLSIITSHNGNIAEDPDSIHQKINYYAVITNTYTNSNGELQTAYVKSNPVEIRILAPLGKVFSDFWQLFQGGEGAFFGIVTTVLLSPIHLPILVLTIFPLYLFFYIQSLIYK